MKKKRIVFTVTNDINFDQRMLRICTSLHDAGYDVTIIGFKKKNSPPLPDRPYKQLRIPIIVEKTKLMYADYWIKLFFVLLFRKADAFCAIDLDTILPVYLVSVLRRKKRVYDAHELFTELQEVVTRPFVLRMWTAIEKFMVPRFKFGYTVGSYIAEHFQKKYGVNYGVVKNATVKVPFILPEKKNRYILYQGAVNIGRCFEYLIPAMKQVDVPMIICGEGNFYAETKALVKEHGLDDKIQFTGYLAPPILKRYTEQAYIGITLFEAKGKSNFYSLANRFFDYMHHGVPQLAMKYPEYERINADYEVALLIEKPDPECIAAALNKLLTDDAYYRKLQLNCMKAREKYCWQEEEKVLLQTYQKLFED